MYPFVMGTSDGDVIPEPFETIRLQPIVTNEGQTTVTGLSGSLAMRPYPRATYPWGVTQPLAAWQDLTPGSSAPADREVELQNKAPESCGEPLTATLDLATDQGRHLTEIEVPTGELSSRWEFPGTVPSLDVEPEYSVGSEREVMSRGPIRDFDVRIDEIRAPVAGDLKIWLYGPNRWVLLLDTRGGAANGIKNLVFDDEATEPLRPGPGPLTGRVKPEEPLTGAEGWSWGAVHTWGITVWNRGAHDVRVGNWTGEVVTATCKNDANELPVADFTVRQPLVKGDRWHVDASRSFDPDGRIRALTLWVDNWMFDLDPSVPMASERFDDLGKRMRVRLEVTDDDYETSTKEMWVKVLDKRPPGASPSGRRTPRRPAGPGAIRASLFVARRTRSSRVTSKGLPARIVCPRACSVTAELQLTRYRARRLGLRGPHPTPKLTMSKVTTKWGLKHRLRLRPSRRFRRALRAHRRVPVLLKVVVRAQNGARHVIPAEIDLER